MTDHNELRQQLGKLLGIDMDRFAVEHVAHAEYQLTVQGPLTDIEMDAVHKYVSSHTALFELWRVRKA